MGSSGGGGGDNTVRYAPYIEVMHENFLGQSQTIYGDSIRVPSASPFKDYIELNYNEAFYGAGYSMASFPSLYDMFGKFMSGLDIEALFEQVLNDVQNTETIQAASNAHRDLLDDDIEQNVLPRFQEGMRDINAVMSSSFIVGKSIIENARVKKLAEFDTNLRYKLIPVAAEIFTKHLAWNQGVISSYLQVMQLAIGTKLDEISTNYEYLAKDKMWPFTVLEQERANLGALQGAVSSPAGDAGASTGDKVIGGILGGGATGATVTGGNSIGAVVGGVLGGIAGIF